ncbi:MAG: hypothetical protein V4498_00885 [candidate division FCPU426 bacterium]
MDTFGTLIPGQIMVPQLSHSATVRTTYPDCWKVKVAFMQVDPVELQSAGLSISFTASAPSGLGQSQTEYIALPILPDADPSRYPDFATAYTAAASETVTAGSGVTVTVAVNFNFRARSWSGAMGGNRQWKIIYLLTSDTCP